MKKTFKTALSLLMALALVMSLAVTAFAQTAQSAADIVYQGEKKLVITPKDGHHTDTDLFGKFKGVMPGDTLTETITFKNESTTSRTDYVKLYIVAVPHGQDNLPVDKEHITDVDAMDAFLANFTMTVKQGDTVIFTGKPNEVGTFGGSGCLLGTFRKGEGTTLTVTLALDINADNTVSDREGEVDWKFIAEEYTSTPGKPPVVTPSSPKTGDESNLFLYAGLCAVSMGMIAVLVLKRKAAKREG